MVKKYSDILSGILLLILAAVVYIGAMEVRTDANGLTSASFPKGAAVLLLLFGIILIVRNVFSLHKNKGFAPQEAVASEADEPHEEGEITVRFDVKSVIISIAIMTVYIVLLKPVGFIIMSILYLFVQVLVLMPKGERKKNLWKAAVLAVVASIAIFFAFSEGLSLTLPAGILSF